MDHTQISVPLLTEFAIHCGLDSCVQCLFFAVFELRMVVCLASHISAANVVNKVFAE